MKRKKGFTIIEMMVAMAVLSMLVIAMSRIFQQSLVATDTGYNLVKGNLVGRTIMQYVAEDLSNCTEWIGGENFEFKRPKIIIDPDETQNEKAYDVQTIVYKINNGILTRNGAKLFVPSEGANNTVEFYKDSLGEGFYIEPDSDTNYFDIFLSVTVKKYVDADEDSIDIKNFATRVYLQNDNRYKYGKYTQFK